MIMCIQNLVKFCPFILKIWSKNLILESIKGRNSVANLRKTTIYFTNVDLVNDDVYTKFGLILSLLPASMKKIRSKMKALEWTQHYTAIFQTDKGR